MNAAAETNSTFAGVDDLRLYGSNEQPRQPLNTMRFYEYR